VPLTFDVHYACGFAQPTSRLLRHFSLYWVVLCWVLEGYGSVWVQWDTQLPIQWIPGTLSLGVKWPGHEADRSSPSSTEVKNAWSYTSTPQYVFMTWCFVKHRDKFFTAQNFCMCLWFISIVYISKFRGLLGMATKHKARQVYRVVAMFNFNIGITSTILFADITSHQISVSLM
jgi:hypothetical protein